MRKTDLLLSAIYVIALIAAATQLPFSSDLSSTTASAEIFPWLVVGTGLLVGVIETLRTIIAKEPAGAPTFGEIWAKAFAARRMMLLGFFVVYLIVIKPLGFLVATALFLFGTISMLTPQPNLKSYSIAAALTAATLGLIYVLLVVYLQAFLP